VTVAWHLAQLNIARLAAPIDAPEIAPFVAALDAVNALAERSPGFVWRLQTDDGNATSVRPFDDERIIVNLTVWTSIDALADYVYRSDHTAFLRRRREWFAHIDGPALVMWWVPAGDIPTLDDAKARLAHLATQGPTAQAFTFRHPFAPDASGTVAPREADERDACPA
jgi:hypothetical protein